MALRRAALILCAALAAPFAGADRAQADPSTPLSSFGDFSADATQVGFDDLGLVNGDDVSEVAGASLGLSSGSPSKFYEDFFARESGLGDVGSVANFLATVRPYPDLTIALPGPMHRVGFEMRVNAADEVSITLLSGGAVMDQVMLPSRGSDALYFYGLQNAAAFDAVQIDVVDHASGAFTLDNLTFENMDEPAPPPDDPGDPGDPGEPAVPVLSCIGFESFPPQRPGHSHHHLPLRALMATLADADGNLLTSADLVAPPQLRVTFAPESGGEAQDVTDALTWRTPGFLYAGRRIERWVVWTFPWEMRRDGTYLATMESGDPTEYAIDPTCADWTLIERQPRPKSKGKGRHGH
jgi:hypothetical protein